MTVSMSKPEKALRIYFVLVFLACTVSGTILLQYKFLSLGYHSDAVFFLQFANKVFDPTSTKTYTFHPTGYNFFGLTGDDGESSIFQTLHLSPVKLAPALVMQVTDSILGYFFAFAFLYFLGFIYLAYIVKINSIKEGILWALFPILLIMYPSTFPSLAFDLRPRMLFFSAIPIAILAFSFSRPFWERALAMMFLLFIREEGIVFAIPLILFNYLHIDANHESKKTSRSLILIWTCYLSLTVIYYFWTRFEYRSQNNSIHYLVSHRWILVVLLIVLILAAQFYFFVSKNRAKHKRLYTSLKYLALLGIAFPPFAQYLIAFPRWYGTQGISEIGSKVARDWLISPHLNIIVSIFITLLFLVTLSIHRKYFLYSTIAQLSLLVFFSWHSVSYFSFYRGNLGNNYYKDLSPFVSGGIFQLISTLDPESAYILADHGTLVAFFEFQNAYSFERIPQSVLAKNNQSLTDLIHFKVDYIVIQKRLNSSIQTLISDSGISVNEIWRSKRFIIYEVIRK